MTRKLLRATTREEYFFETYEDYQQFLSHLEETQQEIPDNLISDEDLDQLLEDYKERKQYYAYGSEDEEAEDEETEDEEAEDEETEYEEAEYEKGEDEKEYAEAGDEEAEDEEEQVQGTDKKGQTQEKEDLSQWNEHTRSAPTK